ncbi:MAG: ABC transporter ATP-binding protein [Bacteroidetes bacterium]|nr:ABC transporter ATP-binding protein [Bacteroidota bacterium]
MIQAKDIVKFYGKLQVLKGINVEVKDKEIVSIVGDSGAGKTTLLQILGTLDSATSGDVLYDQIKVSGLKNKALAEFRNKSIGFIFQFHQLLPEFTCLENVCMPAFIAGKSKKQAEERAKELLEYLGLSHRLHHKPNELSGGEQQRCAVARALINQPKVVFADEPSGNLDSKNASELHKLFLKLRDDFGYSFVIVTHNEEFANMADRKLVMKDGMII